MIRIVSCLAIFLQLFYISSAQSTGCVWNINSDIPDNDPLYFSTAVSNSLLVPSNAGLELGLNQQMKLVCSGKNNVISGTNVQELVVKCVANNLVSYNGANVALKTLGCKSPIVSDLVLSGVKCANGKGEVMKIGFNSASGMAVMLEVCYDRVNDNALFAANKIFYSIDKSEKDGDRPSFRTPGLTSSTAVSNQYKQTEQLKTFTTLLGAGQAAKLLNTTSYLARGHIVPDADYMFGAWSTATYFFTNVAPEWQVVNAGNWLRVETLARDTAHNRNEDIVAYTGTHGVLELPNDSGKLVKMNLLPSEKLRVPKFYWKILYSVNTQEGIAFVTLNNPHAKTISSTDLICKNICVENGWDRTYWAEKEKGYTYCCNVNDLIAAVGVMPSLPVTKAMKSA